MSCLRRYLLNLVFIGQATLLISLTESNKVHFVTYLTSVKSRFECSSLRSAISRGIILTVFGFKDGETEIKGPLSSNPSRLLRHFEESEANSFLDDDIIVFNDGSNVLYRGTASDVERAYLKVEQVNTVLFSAEKNCWPGKGGCAEPPAGVKSSFKYAKTSGFIARYKTLIKFLGAWLEVIESKPFESDDEQLALHQYMLVKGDLSTRVRVAVDSNCTIFQTTTDTNFDGHRWSTPDPKGPYMRIADGVMFNSETNTEPLLYHFNNQNINMLEADKLMWASQLDERNSSPDYKSNCSELLRRYPQIDYCKTDTSVVRSMRFTCGDTIKKAKVREKFVRRTNSSGDWIWFPGHIVPFHIRTDVTTGLPVTRGRVKLLKGNKRYKYADYNKILQCPAGQPELYGKGGALYLANYIPLTQETLMLIAAHLESECGLWNDCRPIVDKYMDKGYIKNIDSVYGLSGQTNAKMFRIVNGSLYYDWPWGRERFDANIEEDESLNYKIPIREVLDQVSDFPDSVFFAGGELVGLPSNIPVPFLSSSPKGSSSSDIPGPWSTAFLNERTRYKKGNYKTVTDEYNEYMLKNSSNTANSSTPAKPLEPLLRHNNIPGTWASRMDKAAFFGSMTDAGLHSHSIARQVVMNIASDYPDDLEANYSVCFQLTGTCYALHIMWHLATPCAVSRLCLAWR
jgi:hypothetical protein